MMLFGQNDWPICVNLACELDGLPSYVRARANPLLARFEFRAGRIKAL